MLHNGPAALLGLTAATLAALAVPPSALNPPKFVLHILLTRDRAQAPPFAYKVPRRAWFLQGDFSSMGRE